MENIDFNKENIISNTNNFISKKPTLFNIDNITYPNNTENHNSQKDNINSNIKSNFENKQIEDKLKSNKAYDESLCDYPQEEFEEEKSAIGSNMRSNQPFENVIFKTMASYIDAKASNRVAVSIEDNIGNKTQQDNVSKINEANESNLNNQIIYNDTPYQTEDLKEKEKNDFKNYEQKIVELQSQLLDLQKEVNWIFLFFINNQFF